MNDNVVENNNLLTDLTLEESKNIADYIKVRNIDIPLEEPKKFEWRFHIKEPEQTLSSYIGSVNPNYKYKALLRLDKDYTSLYEEVIPWLNNIYNIGIIVSDPINVNDASSVISNTFRKSSWKGTLMFPITYLTVEKVRKRNLSQIGHIQYRGDIIIAQAGIEIKDIPMTKCIIITNKDIYDSETGFVFGLTEINGNISLVSTYYFFPEDRRSLLRTLKILTHEFGHTLGIEHCTCNKCIFGGIISFDELDSHPLFPCMADCAKIAISSGRTLKQQLQVIINTCDSLGITSLIQDEYDRVIKALELLHD
jgi:archaemetzincin